MQGRGAVPCPCVERGPVEFTVHYEPHLKGFFMVHTSAFRALFVMALFLRIDMPMDRAKLFLEPPQKDSAGTADLCRKGTQGI